MGSRFKDAHWMFTGEWQKHVGACWDHSKGAVVPPYHKGPLWGHLESLGLWLKLKKVKIDR